MRTIGSTYPDKPVVPSAKKGAGAKPKGKCADKQKEGASCPTPTIAIT